MKKKQRISSFGNTQPRKAELYRPERESSIAPILKNKKITVLPRGKGLSYGDVCLHDTLIDTSRLNRVLAFEKDTNNITVEPGVTFKDLLYLDKHRIPPVLPGTIHASIAGGVANDVHGKNHYHQGALGEHINWIELALPSQTLKVSETEHAPLFHATIGGLGLTGFIQKINLRMQTHSKRLAVQKVCFNDIYQCVNLLQSKAPLNDFTAAWCDFYQEGRGILFSGNHILGHSVTPPKKNIHIPFTPPFSLVTKWGMRYFNKRFYRQTLNRPTQLKQDLETFNNPLDRVKHFNRLYGVKGFYQLQCVVPLKNATAFLEQCLALFKAQRTFPSLCVIKMLGHKGKGLLSFTEPGLSIALDFPYRNKRLLQSLYSLLIEFNGKVYLAKDNLLDKHLFRIMYPKHENFIEVLHHYGVYDSFQSSMSKRLGIH
jgi:FAD/FMN-containing dehydrogenase